MNRYYIAVPNKTEPSYQTIFTWTNYSFTGTYEDAMQTGIELFEEHGLLDNIIEDLIYFYDEGNSGDNDDDSDEEDKLIENDWDEWDIQENGKIVKNTLLKNLILMIVMKLFQVLDYGILFHMILKRIGMKKILD